MDGWAAGDAERTEEVREEHRTRCPTTAHTGGRASCPVEDAGSSTSGASLNPEQIVDSLFQCLIETCEENVT